MPLNTPEEIKAAIESLSDEELCDLRRWLTNKDQPKHLKTVNVADLQGMLVATRHVTIEQMNPAHPDKD